LNYKIILLGRSKFTRSFRLHRVIRLLASCLFLEVGRTIQRNGEEGLWYEKGVGYRNKQDRMGPYLAELLLEKGYKVYGLTRRSSTIVTDRISHIWIR
jgi:hypothetical protein